MIREKAELSVNDLLMLDQMFRRYLRLEDLKVATMFVLKFKECLSGISGCIIELESLGWGLNNSCLDATCLSYTEVFTKYFDGFECCFESAKGFCEDWGVYKPVRTIVCDMP